MVPIPSRKSDDDSAEDLPCLQITPTSEVGSPLEPGVGDDDIDEEAQIVELRNWLEKVDRRRAQRSLAPRRDAEKPTVLGSPAVSSLWQRRAAAEPRLQE
eukprot:CAMPEP_0178438566 /NCGR_PEP_ID=MMETSP0689_2-20121128/35660_1 /TAXON_ID=160604 /ORGANISM="Amphidinium massartii, Strain CS-259" /LENGTH=99 /DNA_ID=CAMNT_0020060975 /DNA_START=153 /DNA_END=452 /DNA_ORIENTATION=+